MKKCKTCGLEQFETEYWNHPLTKDGLQTSCKSCRRASNRNGQKEYYKRNKNKCKESTYRWQAKMKERWLEILVEKFGNIACSKCGYNKNLAAIDFHHTKSENKDCMLSQMRIRKPTPERIMELDRVTPLCSNCHRELRHPVQ